MPSERQMVYGFLFVGFVLFSLFTGTVWVNAAWVEFIRPSEPEWWVMPLEYTGVAMVGTLCLSLIFMLVALPFWTRHLPFK